MFLFLFVLLSPAAVAKKKREKKMFLFLDPSTLFRESHCVAQAVFKHKSSIVLSSNPEVLEFQMHATTSSCFRLQSWTVTARMADFTLPRLIVEPACASACRLHKLEPGAD